MPQSSLGDILARLQWGITSTSTFFSSRYQGNTALKLQKHLSAVLAWRRSYVDATPNPPLRRLAADESIIVGCVEYPKLLRRKIAANPVPATKGKRSTYRTTKRDRVLKILRRAYACCHPGTRLSANSSGFARPHLFICDTLKFPRVPARVSEAIVLRTYPFKEADLVVSFLTRDQGKLRGVAKRARRPKSLFGSGLERLSHVRMAYFQRESHELVNLDSCELIRSQFDLASDYQASIALDFFAEATDLLLPSGEASEKFFRLLVAVLESLRTPAVNPGDRSGVVGDRSGVVRSLWCRRSFW